MSDEVVVGLCAVLEFFFLIGKYDLFDGYWVIDFIFGEGYFEHMIFFIFGFDLVFVPGLHDKLNSCFFGAY